LGLANHQLTEITSNEFVIGLGYIFRELPISIRSGGSTRTFRSDLNIKIDFSVRNNKTILRKVNEQYDQISAGQKVYTINASADYQLNERFTLRLFFDRIMNKPYISSQYPNSNTNAGISVRFSLAQ
jgi:cell surface protein SprA